MSVRRLYGSWWFVPFVASIVIAMCAGVAEAKPRKRSRKQADVDVVATTMVTSLRAKPGEAAKIVIEVPSGTKVRVLERKGRWLHVEANGKRGWITRTTVEAEPSKAKRRKRGSLWGGRAADKPSDATATAPAAPADASDGDELNGRTVEVLARRTDVFVRPSARSLVAFRVEQGDRLVIAGHAKRRRWLLVDAGGSRTGWIAAAAVAVVDGRSSVRAAVRARDADPGDADAEEDAALTATGTARVVEPLPRFALRGAADLGVRSLGMDFTSDVQAGLGNYVVSTQAATVGVGGELRWQLGSRLVLGADASYRMTHSTPGIRYESSAGAMGDIAFSTHEVDGGAQLGVRFGGRAAPIDVFARGGAHYEVFIVDDLGNVGRMPNEALSGATVGLGVDVPRFDDDLAIGVRVDMLLGGRRGQTAGLEDGELDSARAVGARFVGLSPRSAARSDASLPVCAHRHDLARPVRAGRRRRRRRAQRPLPYLLARRSRRALATPAGSTKGTHACCTRLLDPPGTDA